MRKQYTEKNWGTISTCCYSKLNDLIKRLSFSLKKEMKGREKTKNDKDHVT